MAVVDRPARPINSISRFSPTTTFMASKRMCCRQPAPPQTVVCPVSGRRVAAIAAFRQAPVIITCRIRVDRQAITLLPPSIMAPTFSTQQAATSPCSSSNSSIMSFDNKTRHTRTRPPSHVYSNLNLHFFLLILINKTTLVFVY